MGALGDQLYVEPFYRDGDKWTGNIIDRGAKVIKFSTYTICDVVEYQTKDIIKTISVDGKPVHIIYFQNIRKIEGVY
jgi:hypothetical protein